jgi:pentatricopeptide repeat protein
MITSEKLHGQFMALLQACAKKKDIYIGSRLHAYIMARHQAMLRQSPYLASALINMYAKCGDLPKAQLVLEELPERNVVSWSALVGAYAQQGLGEEALACFGKLKQEGFCPDVVTYTCVLKACSSARSVTMGRQIHDEVISRGLLGTDLMLGNALVDMYAKCGALARAKQVLEELPIRNVISWSALIVGYAQHGHGREALECFQLMENEGLSPDAVIFSCVLKSCGRSGAVEMGKRIHDKVAAMGLLEKDIDVGNALIDMYAKCRDLVKARRLIEEIPRRDTISWNALLAGYTQQGQGREALDCFECMQNDGASPDKVTLACVLKACGITGDVEKGERIHEEAVNRGLLTGKDIALSTAVLDMYAKCGMLVKAQESLDEMLIRNAVSWSALISGYVHHERDREAINCFEAMRFEGIIPDSVALICVLRACGNIGALEKGEHIAEKVLAERGMLMEDSVLGAAIVDMYVKCGGIEKARKALQQLPHRDLLSWNALISGYVEQEKANEALECFERMQISDGITPDLVTLACVLKACGNAGAIGAGEQIHGRIGFEDEDSVVMIGTALVDMYAKCGSFAKARNVLRGLPRRNTVSWNALIAGYSRHGRAHEAVACFEKLLDEGLSPNKVTFLCLLAACTRSGLLDAAEMLLAEMIGAYGIPPDLEHRTCMVLVCGFRGDIDAALARTLQSLGRLEVWVALLGICRQWGNVRLGSLAFDQAMRLDSTCAAAYALMASIFGGAGLREDAERVEAMRSKYGARQGSLTFAPGQLSGKIRYMEVPS